MQFLASQLLLFKIVFNQRSNFGNISHNLILGLIMLLEVLLTYNNLIICIENIPTIIKMFFYFFILIIVYLQLKICK
jgi:hypothetical protein